MHDMQEPGNEQARLWNGPAGRAWVDRQPLLDRLFAPLGTLLIESLAGHSLGRVLDVGCGTGAVTLALASPSGDAGECVGIDISAPMIEAARARAEREGSRARFVCADAQAHGCARCRLDHLGHLLVHADGSERLPCARHVRLAVGLDGVIHATHRRGHVRNSLLHARSRRERRSDAAAERHT